MSFTCAQFVSPLAAVLLLGLIGCGDVSEEGEAALSLSGLARGEALYQMHCAQCHGAEGEGNAGFPSLQTPHINMQSDGKLFALIQSGTGGRMPAFQEVLSEEEVVDVIDYLRSLQASASDE